MLDSIQHGWVRDLQKGELKGNKVPVQPQQEENQSF
jgi:hypothetical protein